MARPNSSSKQEIAFQDWYAKQAYENGLSTNPDDPEHYYDWRAAHNAGAEGELADDGYKHWPSEFKSPDHPNRFVDGIDTITGKPVVSGPQAWGAAPQQGPSPAPADSSYMDYLASLVSPEENTGDLGYFGKDPKSMDRWHEEAKPPEYDQFLAAAQPALTELSQKFLDKYDEDGSLSNTLTQNYTDIYNNILGQPYDKGNQAAKEWVDTFIGLMQSHNPGGDNAEIAYRDPEEVDNGIDGYLDNKFAFDKAGVLRSQMLNQRKLNLLKTFQEGDNTPPGSGVIDKGLADIGTMSGLDGTGDTAKLSDLRYGGRPADKVKEAMYWWNESDKLNDPNTKNYRDMDRAYTPEKSWLTYGGMGAGSYDTNTFLGNARNNTYGTLANLSQLFNQKNSDKALSGLWDYLTGTEAIGQPAPPIPKNLRPAATAALPMQRLMEQASFVDPAVEWVRLQKNLGVQNPSYPSLFATSMIGGIRENLDIQTLLSAGLTGGLSILGKTGARSAAKAAAGSIFGNVAEDFGQEAPLNAIIGQSYQPEGDSIYDYFAKEGPGLTDDQGKPVAANSPQWEKWDDLRTKQYDTRFATIADLGSQLGKPQPAAEPVVPLQPQTPYDKEYDQWQKSMVKPQPTTQSQQGQKYMDYLSNMRR